MIELTVRPARTSFSGPEKQLKKMFRCLRVLDKNSWWKAKASLRRKIENFYYIPYREQQALIEKEAEKFKYIKFYDRRSDTFASGLLSRVEKFLKKKGIKYEITFWHGGHVLQKFEEVKKFHFVDKVETRPEQIETVNKALQKGRGIIHCATNFGKTEVACAIIAEFSKQTHKMPLVLFLIHRAGLVQQTAERFKQHLFKSRICTLGGGKKVVPKKGIVVATVQTASNLLRTEAFETFQEQCDILFIDELHINKAWQCSNIVKNNQAPMRFSLSGTVDRKNKVKMLHYMGMTGPIIAETKNKELVDLGRSAKPIIRFIEVNTTEIPKRSGFAAGYSLGIVKNKKRNSLIVKETLRYLKKDYKTLVTVSRISHGLTLKGMLEKEIDLRVEFLSGSSPMEVRKKVIRQFEKGKVGVLIASPIFDTGVDIPNGVDAWVNAAGGRSWELTLQRLGRVLRRNPRYGNKVRVTDFVDKHNWYLFRHSLRRIKHYSNENLGGILVVENA